MFRFKLRALKASCIAHSETVPLTKVRKTVKQSVSARRNRRSKTGRTVELFCASSRSASDPLNVNGMFEEIARAARACRRVGSVVLKSDFYSR